MLRRSVMLLALAGSSMAAGEYWMAATARAADEVPAYITAAVNDPGRLPEEKATDAGRKPAEMLAFAGVKPGDKVVDVLAGGGYFTRMFAKAVGPKGHVYAVDPDDGAKMHGDTLKKIAADPAYGNVTLLVDPVTRTKTPEPVDIVWISLDYHDLHNSGAPAADIADFNKAVFAMLKPGGVYIVVDHSASANAPADVTNTLHRIDPATVKKEVTAAGFRLDAQSDALRNMADDHSLIVFNPKIRGKTDQFVLRFRKPK